MRNIFPSLPQQFPFFQGSFPGTRLWSVSVGCHRVAGRRNKHLHTPDASVLTITPAPADTSWVMLTGDSKTFLIPKWMSKPTAHIQLAKATCMLLGPKAL